MLPFLIAVCLVGIGSVWAGENLGFDYATLDRVQGRFVDEQGRVDYAGLKAASEGLLGFVQTLGEMSPESHPERFETPKDRLAYWINAYNALVLKGVIDVYPVRSVEDIQPDFGFFKTVSFPVGGNSYTLNEIEHEVIRKQFQDPRIHAAINCASASCPRLPQTVFLPGILEAQLDAAMRAFVGDRANVWLDQKQGILHLPEIFRWFVLDFTDWYRRENGVVSATIQDYLKPYLDAENRLYLEQNPTVRVEYITYDWSLNNQENQ